MDIGASVVEKSMRASRVNLDLAEAKDAWQRVLKLFAANLKG